MTKIFRFTKLSQLPKKYSSLLRKFVNYGRKYIYKIWLMLCAGSTVVEHLTRNLKIKGLNPATDSGREKAVKALSFTKSFK